jgi:hypothetical protein
MTELLQSQPSITSWNTTKVWQQRPTEAARCVINSGTCANAWKVTLDKKWPYRVIISPNEVPLHAIYPRTGRAVASTPEQRCSKKQFAKMNQPVDLLGIFNSCMQALSVEVTHTIHLVIVVLYNLNVKLFRVKNESRTCAQ